MQIIKEKTKGDCELGGKDDFSDTDIRKLNTLYECKGYKQVGSDYSDSNPRTTTKNPWVKSSCVDSNE